MNRRKGARFNRGRIATASGVAIPLGADFWTGGGYFDLRQLSDAQGATRSTAINALAGSASLTPVGAPVVSGHGIAGNKSLYFDGTSQYLRCDALGTLFNGSDKAGTVFIRYRSISGSTQSLITCGNSAGATDNFLKVRASTLQFVEVLKDAAAEATVTRTGTTQLQYDEHTIVVVFTGTTVVVYVDGVADTLDNSGLDTASVTFDRGAIGAFLSSTASEFFNGYVQIFGFSPQQATAAQALAFDTAVRASDFTRAKSASKEVAIAGDSITQGSTATGGGGFRVYLGHLRDYNKLSYNFVGQFAAGIFPDRQHSSQGGATCATIATLVNADIDTAGGVDIVFLFGGTNNVDTGAAGALTAYTSMLSSVRTKANSYNANTIIFVSTILPIGSPQAGFDQWATFNAGLPAIWDASDAAFPGMPTLRRLDFATAFGNVYNAANYVDLVHPNDTGYALMGAHIMAGARADMFAQSATIATQACNILSPTAGTTLTQGTLANLNGCTTRTTNTGLVRDDQGDSWGAVTMAAIPYTGALPNQTWTSTYTPVAGDVGSRTIHAEVTDAVTAATASGSNVAVTVQAPTAQFSDYGTLVGWWSLLDPSSYVQDGTNVTAITNKVTSVTATEATAPPGWSASGGVNGHPAMTFLKASSQKLVSATDATAAGWLVGSQKPFTWIGWVEFPVLSDTSFHFSIAGSATANQGLMIGQQTVNKYRCFRQDSAANTSNILSTPNTASGWHLVLWAFDGTDNYFSVDAGSETVTAAPLAGSIAGCNRWAFGCRGDSAPDTFGTVNFSADVVLYSNFLDATNRAAALALAQSRAA